MRPLDTLALAALLAERAPDAPPPVEAPVVAPVVADSAGGGIPGPTSDEIDAGADILEDALGDGASP